MEKEEIISEIIEKLSPLELKIVPYLNYSIKEIEKKANLDNTSVIRALQFLSNKKILEFSRESKEVIELGTNGIYYKKNHLPERKLLMTLESNNHLSLEEAKRLSKLSDNEFRVSLGILKKKALINLSNGKISLTAKKSELVKKFLEEQFIDALPLDGDKLIPEQKFALNNLKNRKNIIEIKQTNIVNFNLTELGKSIAGKEIKSSLIEEISSDVIKNWSRGEKFRRYDIEHGVPKIYGGKKHFVNQSIEYAKRVWTDLGFKEITGALIETSFWNFDALFTAQDHPAREMQDTFFIKKMEGKLPDNALVGRVKTAHEKGIAGSRGWNYAWKENEAKKIVLRTHTTPISARALSQIKESELPVKYFAIGKVFRNETIDWNHGFEFYQTEGIVVDKNANFRHLLGYLKEFYNKMGFEKIRFRPSFFAYTEPSVEVEVFHPEKNIWLELGGAGMFRPEVTAPLLGKPIPVLAWGQGFDRIIMDYYKIKDLREMYSNNMQDLRERKAWIR